MEPFRIPAELEGFSRQYPNAKEIARISKAEGEKAGIIFSRLWLSEGIPFAFKENPAVFESLRTWLSIQLEVHAKEVGVTGSAQLGTSLSPKQLGSPFDSESDLDLFVISSSLFDQIKRDFQRWSCDYESGACQPKNVREENFWRNNLERGQTLILRGFLDQKMVPNRQEYAMISKISHKMWLLTKKLKLTKNAPNPAKASLRCYSSWDAFVRQVTMSLGSE